MTTPVVQFNYATWRAGYPEFAAITEPQAERFFDNATLIFANATSNPAFCDGNMEKLLYLLTSHIAALSPPPGQEASQGGPQLVGRIASASQGSESVSAQWDGSGTPGESWFVQTQYGALFWAATAQYRTARYMAQPTFVPSAIFPMRRPWGR